MSEEKDSAQLEEYLAMVKEDGMKLIHVPPEYRTPELCMEAVKQNCGAILYVPESCKSYELCMLALTDYSQGARNVPGSTQEAFAAWMNMVKK